MSDTLTLQELRQELADREAGLKTVQEAIRQTEQKLAELNTQFHTDNGAKLQCAALIAKLEARAMPPPSPPSAPPALGLAAAVPAPETKS